MCSGAPSSQQLLDEDDLGLDWDAARIYTQNACTQDCLDNVDMEVSPLPSRAPHWERQLEPEVIEID